MTKARSLVIVADDLGMGPETTRGILELSHVLTGTVLLVNSPHAEAAVAAWRAQGSLLELGWHPNLTVDAPVAPPEQVSSLLDEHGLMGPLPRLVRRLYLRQVNPNHIEIELRAQYQRFREMTGQYPLLVNSHQHIAVFPPIGRILRAILSEQKPHPFLRRVQEPMTTLYRIPGSRMKRLGLSLLGFSGTRKQIRESFPGAEGLIGITDPPQVRHPTFFERWLTRTPGNVVELMCHPGHWDATLIGRDCGSDDGYLQRRVDEYQWLSRPDFLEACQAAGFRRVPASRLLSSNREGRRHVA